MGLGQPYAEKGWPREIQFTMDLDVNETEIETVPHATNRFAVIK